MNTFNFMFHVLTSWLTRVEFARALHDGSSSLWHGGDPNPNPNPSRVEMLPERPRLRSREVPAAAHTSMMLTHVPEALQCIAIDGWIPRVLDLYGRGHRYLWAWPPKLKIRTISSSNLICPTASEPIPSRKEPVSPSCLFCLLPCSCFCFPSVPPWVFTEHQGHVAVSVAAKSLLGCRWVPNYSLCAFNSLHIPSSYVIRHCAYGARTTVTKTNPHELQ